MSTKQRQRYQDRHPEIAQLVRELSRSQSLDQVAQALEERGFVNSKGKRFNASGVSRMLAD